MSDRMPTDLRIGGTAIQVYDQSKPAQVHDRHGVLLWEGPDIVDALRAFRERGGARVTRDGVLLASAAVFSSSERWMMLTSTRRT